LKEGLADSEWRQTEIEEASVGQQEKWRGDSRIPLFTTS